MSQKDYRTAYCNNWQLRSTSLFWSIDWRRSVRHDFITTQKKELFQLFSLVSILFLYHFYFDCNQTKTEAYQENIILPGHLKQTMFGSQSDVSLHNNSLLPFNRKNSSNSLIWCQIYFVRRKILVDINENIYKLCSSFC